MGLCWLEWVADGADCGQMGLQDAQKSLPGRYSCWISVAVVLFVCHAVVGSS